MADHLLKEGLAGASLRPLAAAAGTSDRMLLHYFRDKDELLATTLERIALRLTDQLDAALPACGRRSFPTLLDEVWAALGSVSVKPFMHLWLDIAAFAARGAEPHRTIAGHMADGFLTWIESGWRRTRASSTIPDTPDGHPEPHRRSALNLHHLRGRYRDASRGKRWRRYKALIVMGPAATSPQARPQPCDPVAVTTLLQRPSGHDLPLPRRGGGLMTAHRSARTYGPASGR